MVDIIKTEVKETLDHNSRYGHVMKYFFNNNIGVSGVWNSENQNIEVCQFVHDAGYFKHFDIDSASVVENHLAFAKYVEQMQNA